ncbi:MAG: nucleotidyltransferase domain-containing protein [Candidatus Hodarchaeota archaeon]
MREKITTRTEEEFIAFSEETTQVLQIKRNRAKLFLEIIAENNIPSYIYGSIVRGDITKTSDIDVIIPYPVSSMLLELTLEKLKIESRNISQATPNHTPKAHIRFSNETTVTFPLIPFRDREANFYHFAGVCTLAELNLNQLKPGVNKRLELIKPISKSGVKGFVIAPVIGQESYVAKLLNIPLDVVQERVRVLTQRDKRGRTGVFLNRPLDDDEQFEKVLYNLKAQNVALRRYLQRRNL